MPRFLRLVCDGSCLLFYSPSVNFYPVIDDIIKKLMNWRHSGFSVHNKAWIAKDDEKGRVALAQYIVRNTFSLEKLTYNQETGAVIYRSKMTSGKNKKNFHIYTAEEFIAAITQHIPKKIISDGALL